MVKGGDPARAILERMSLDCSQFTFNWFGGCHLFNAGDFRGPVNLVRRVEADRRVFQEFVVKMRKWFRRGPVELSGG